MPIAGSQSLVCLLALNAGLHPPEVVGCCLLADRLTAGRWALRLRRASHRGPVEPLERLTAGAYSLLVTGFPNFALGCDLCVGHYLLEPAAASYRRLLAASCRSLLSACCRHLQALFATSYCSLGAISDQVLIATLGCNLLNRCLGRSHQLRSNVF